ncbi:hypothetical protein M0805_005281 [Coniferiporia weirii]|nr:hypothetical protein M0805_005281 [Coniferiporia weirii]
MPRAEECTYASVCHTSNGKCSCAHGIDANPPSTLRERRELRYSRDQQALLDDFRHCASEASQIELQISALERVSGLLKAKVCEGRDRISHLRERLAEADGGPSEDLVNQQTLEEHWLAVACREEKAVANQLVQLRQTQTSSALQSADVVTSRPTRGSRKKTNLNLFLQKSPTKRPLQVQKLRSRSIDLLPRGVASRSRYSAPEACWNQRYTSHFRSRSLIEGPQVTKLCRHSGLAAQLTVSQPSSLDSKVAAFSLQANPDINGCDERRVSAVDAFTNSFSSRVISPPLLSARRNLSLRQLRISERQRQSVPFPNPAKVAVARSEYGVVTILPRETPSSESVFVGDLLDVPLPSYVQKLMNVFEQNSEPSLSFSLPERDVPMLRKPVTPSLEQPQTFSPITPTLSPKTKSHNLLRKQRSIFTLRLHVRPVPDLASRSTLAASSSASVSDSVVYSASAVPASGDTASHPKGLPSTRNYDLHLLGKAPDDLPETPTATAAGFHLPSTPRRGMVSGPLAALRDVKSRLVTLAALIVAVDLTTKNVAKTLTAVEVDREFVDGSLAILEKRIIPPPPFQQLRDGNLIPLLGFGTYEIEGREAYDTVKWALEAGYRHIDSAAWYENEKEVGNAILDFCKAHQVPRSEIYYTTKLRSNDGYQASKDAIQKSVDDCALGYIDLYLIHGPLGGPQARMDSWRAALDAKAEGKLRSIGVSNYGVKHIQEILDAGVELPAVNQIDLHPFMVRAALVDFCQRHEIALGAWGPLVRAHKFGHPLLVKIAKKYGKEVPHVLLRYSLQKGFIPLPKTVSKERMISNTDIYDFELTDDEINGLDGLDEYLITDWDPSDCP